MAKKRKLTSVITGDLINSRIIKNSKRWLGPLRKTLSLEGNTPQVWEIYRGDSLQIEVKDPAKALLTAIRIKATVKCIKGLDVRLAIGIGTKEFESSKITEANGPAFINSGEKLENLKKEKQNLAIKTPWPDFDREMNLLMRLASIAMDNWTPSLAELIKILINDENMTQVELADKLGIYQSSVSDRQRRAYFSEIMEVNKLYREKIAYLSSLK